MDNRGKLWSIDDDQKLMESPHLPNSYFCSSMGRSDNAIKMRRSHLAAKMFQNDPSSATLEEYVSLMHGDIEHAQQLLQEWSEKRATFKNFMDANRKRKNNPALTDPAGGHRVASRFFREEAEARAGPDLPKYWHDRSPEERISDICESIREEEGNLASVFNDSQFLPILVQHYPGFEAYARIVQARLVRT
jgi:hypothetical protein